MTNGEHDLLWRRGAKALPDIAEQLERIADQLAIYNTITILKESYAIGEISKEDYAGALNEAMIVSKRM